MTTPLTRRRHDAAHDRDLNVARIADALERIAEGVGPLMLLAGHLTIAGNASAALGRIADAFETAVMPDVREDEEAEREPGPDDAPASPEDATAWRPVKGGRALLDVDGPLEVVVDRIYRSEGVDMAVVVDELGATFTTPATNLREPRS